MKFKQILNLAEELIKLDPDKGIELKKQVLLEECKRRYHNGTKIKSALENSVWGTINTNKFLAWKTNEINGCILADQIGNITIYHANKFAEIIEYPLFRDNGKFWYKSDFKEDDIFVVTYRNKHNYLFRFKELTTRTINSKNHIFIENNDFSNSEDYLMAFTDVSNIRKATQEEISWLEKCEKANKFVPKDYSFQDTTKEQTVRVERNDSKCEVSIKTNNPVLQDYNTIQLLNIAKDVVNLGENYKYEQELSKLKEKYGINE